MIIIVRRDFVRDAGAWFTSPARTVTARNCVASANENPLDIEGQLDANYLNWQTIFLAGPGPGGSAGMTRQVGREDESASLIRRTILFGDSADRPWSLSPAALRRAPFVPRLVAAVGRFLRGSAGPVTVIAAGERWPDGSLRPALENLLGAGAILAALRDLGGFQVPATLGGPGSGVFSPEAEATRACFEATADVAAAVSGCASGRELIEGGFGDDVAIATEIDACLVVPVVADGAFTAATGQ